MFKTLLSLFVLYSFSNSKEALNSTAQMSSPITVGNEKKDDSKSNDLEEPKLDDPEIGIVDLKKAPSKKIIYILTLNNPHTEEILNNPKIGSNKINKDKLLTLEMLENLSQKPDDSILCRNKARNIMRFNFMRPIFLTAD